MKTLSVNAGSSSLKFTLFEMPDEKEIINGVFERIGSEESFYTIKLNGEKIKKEFLLNDHKEAFKILVKELLDNKIVENLEEIKGIGHRVVQGGSYFDQSVIVNEDNLNKITELAPLAPLHNPAAITGINAAIAVFPNAVQTLVFDTAFHQTMPDYNYIYPVPYEWYEKYSVRKYGAHGTSHKYISQRANEILGHNDTKLIICHIGNGASISAVKNGICINTSMGLTPNAGLMMGTRCGDIDATIIPYIMNVTGMSVFEVENKLNKEAGLLGVSGISNDSRDIVDGIAKGEKRCLLAEELYVKKIVDYIAMYYLELGGADAIIFTAGVGENAREVREEVIKRLAVLNIKLDIEQNNCRGVERLISTSDSAVKVYIIPTNEELMIARDTYNLIK